MYIDPGSGSMIIQMIIAGLAACGGILIILRDRIKGVFKRGKKNDEAVSEDLPDSEELLDKLLDEQVQDESTPSEGQ